MKIVLTAIGAMALAAPALAQMATVNAQLPSVAVQLPSVDARLQAGASGSAVVPPVAVPALPVAQTAEAIIAAEFSTYDKDGNGALSAVEFDSWMLALKAKSGAKAMTPTAKKSWLTGAFATADTDKNKVVSQTELTTYLTAGA